MKHLKMFEQFISEETQQFAVLQNAKNLRDQEESRRRKRSQESVDKVRINKLHQISGDEEAEMEEPEGDEEAEIEEPEGDEEAEMEPEDSDEEMGSEMNY